MSGDPTISNADPPSGDGFAVEAAGLAPLTDDERAVYEWQMWVRGLGESGQRRLKGASVLVSRCGGVGGAAATYLAAAGVGRLVIAHAGVVHAPDLNRQTLMSYEGIGQSRIEQIRRRLTSLNPWVQLEAVAENISDANADRLVSSVDVVIDAAPLFQERHAMNAAAVRHHKPMVECAMFETDVHVTTILPGSTACLACIYPGVPPEWKRQFPVLGAVAGIAGTFGATEAIKLITGLGEPLAGRMLVADMLSMRFRTVQVARDPDCPVCGGSSAGASRHSADNGRTALPPPGPPAASDLR